eukprot:TRINITY_DN34_c0_g1_i1.p1 TRINITY_DN34_c0_g1~~TRINITY_DN34_c0_g1_i1.p1  ORF type:complete len:152 (-),score=49.82 TRINITY_DN34_c0_g1_i1:169-624(-)
MAEKTQQQIEAEERKKRAAVRKFTFRGMELEDLLKLSNEKLIEHLRARQRRRFNRGLKHKYQRLMTKLRKAKKGLEPGAKPAPVKTHLRNAIITPEMVGSVVGIHSGRGFTNVEIKFDMIGHYLGEFSITYKPTTHGKPGVGATKSSAHTD